MLRSLCATAAVLSALTLACGDSEHPQEVVGTWVSDSTRGGVLRVLDSLILSGGGAGRSHRTLYGYSLRDTTVTDKAGAITWRVVRNEDGRHLCLSGEAEKERECAPLRVMPETELQWGVFRFRRLP